MKNYLNQFFVKNFKKWTKFEIILWLTCIVLVTTFSIVFKSGILIMSCSLVGAASTFLQAKGKPIAQFFVLGTVVLYSIVSYNQALYGEALTYIFLMMPFAIASLISWIKNTDEEKTVRVNELSKKEWSFVPLFSLIVFVGVYFILRALNTYLLVVSTISVVSSVISVYLMIRRSKYGFISLFVDELSSIVLWAIPVILGNLALIPLLINPIVNSINHLYGWKVWTKKIKRQNERKRLKELENTQEIEKAKDEEKQITKTVK